MNDGVGDRPVDTEAYAEWRNTFISNAVGIPVPENSPGVGDFLNPPSFADLLLWVFMLQQDVYAKALFLAPRFMIDNVAAWHRATRTEGKPFSWDDLPNIAPLGPEMWFEYSSRSIGVMAPWRYGCLITVDYDSEGSKTSKWGDVSPPSDVRWVLRLVYFSTSEEGIGESDWTYFIMVSALGEPLGMSSFEHGAPYVKPDLAQKDVMHEECLLALLALCFCHCKNVIIEEKSHPRAVRRELEKKARPVTTYKVLDIGPTTRILREEGDIARNGMVRALHICRGHFAHYTEEKPLFGKLVGTYYIPQHVRGTAKAGVVVKDYNVRAAQS